jgi:hypothetical protein
MIEPEPILLELLSVAVGEAAELSAKTAGALEIDSDRLPDAARATAAKAKGLRPTRKIRRLNFIF